MDHELERKRARLLTALPMGWAFHRDLLLIVGSDAGAIANEFREVGQQHVLVAVPPGSPDPVGLPDGVYWFAAKAVGAAVRNVGNGPIEHVWMVRTGDPNETPELLDEIRRDAVEALRTRAFNFGTIGEFGRRWLLQGIENLPVVAEGPSVAHLDGAFRGRPAVLVSPGPSLSKQLGLLATLRERAVVIAGSHSLHALERAGARVDVAIAIDAGEMVERHFEGLDLAAIGSLVAAVTLRPTILNLPIPRRFLASVNGPLDDWAYRPAREAAHLATGGSVACAAFSLALRMGCDPIVFVGQDLAFEDGRFYASEALDGEVRVAEEGGRFFLKKSVEEGGPGVVNEHGDLQFTKEQGVTELPGYHGGVVRSSEYLRQFHAWFERELRARPGVARFVNSTEGGACIRGTEQVPFAEMVAGFEERFDVIGVLRERASVPVDERRATYRAYVADLMRALDESTFLAHRCRRVLDRARNDERSLVQLERMERDLTRALQPVGFFALFAQEELTRAQELARSATSLDDNLDAIQELTGVVVEAAELLRAPLQVAAAELETRACGSAPTDAPREVRSGTPTEVQSGDVGPGS